MLDYSGMSHNVATRMVWCWKAWMSYRQLVKYVAKNLLLKGGKFIFDGS